MTQPGRLFDGEGRLGAAIAIRGAKGRRYLLTPGGLLVDDERSNTGWPGQIHDREPGRRG